MSKVSATTPFDPQPENWWSKGSSRLAQQLCDASQFLRGLRVHEAHKSTTSTGGFGSMLSVFLKSSTEEHMVKGAVLHGSAPRLLHIDDIDIEAPLGCDLIYLRNLRLWQLSSMAAIAQLTHALLPQMPGKLLTTQFG